MSSSNKGLPPIAYIAGALVLTGGGYALYTNRSSLPAPIANIATSNNNSAVNAQFNVPTTVASGTVLKIGGSTSMAQINQSLKLGFEQKFPGVRALPSASSSGKGLTDIVAGSIDITGISRELTADEKAQSLVSVPIVQDKIAIVVGNANDLRTGLTADQVAKIFTGEVTNWSQVGSKALPIRPILRPATSGTHQSFQEIGLKGKNFGTGSGFKILERDATTPLLQALGADGIGYATYAQIANQSTVRSVAIDSNLPDMANYPYIRTLSYVYKGQPNDAVKAFLGFATSNEGQKLITQQAQSK
jgi:phosphate transport system substrate-binding protein